MEHATITADGMLTFQTSIGKATIRKCGGGTYRVSYPSPMNLWSTKHTSIADAYEALTDRLADTDAA